MNQPQREDHGQFADQNQQLIPQEQQISGLITGIRQQRRPNTSSAISILQDGEFMVALADTTEYSLNPDKNLTFSDIQSVLRPEHVDLTRVAASRLCAALWEVLDGKYFSNTEPRLNQEREHNWFKYLNIIADHVQAAAETFKESTLWKVLDEQVIAQLLPDTEQFIALRSSLSSIRDLSAAGDTSSLLAVFTHLRELANSLESGQVQQPIFAALAAGFALRGIEFALKALKVCEIKDVQSFSSREQLASDFGNTLARELGNYKVVGHSPLFNLLARTGSRGVNFADEVFKGYFNIGESVFFEAQRDRRSPARKLIDGIEKFGQAACSIWPDTFPGKIMDRFNALHGHHQASALCILQYGISDKKERVTFVVEKGLILLRNQHGFVQERVIEVLRNLSEPLAEYLSQDFIQSKSARENASIYTQQILEKIFAHEARLGNLTEQARLALTPYLLAKLENPNSDSSVRLASKFGELFAVGSLQHTEKDAREYLLAEVLYSYINNASNKYSLSRDMQEQRALSRFIASFGYPGVIYILEQAIQRRNSIASDLNQACAQAAQLLASSPAEPGVFIRWLNQNAAKVFSDKKSQLQVTTTRSSDDFIRVEDQATSSIDSLDAMSQEDKFELKSANYQALTTFLALPFVDDELRTEILKGGLLNDSLHGLLLKIEINSRYVLETSEKLVRSEAELALRVERFLNERKRQAGARTIELKYVLAKLIDFNNQGHQTASQILNSPTFKSFIDYSDAMAQHPLSFDGITKNQDHVLEGLWEVIKNLHSQLEAEQVKKISRSIKAILQPWFKSYNPTELSLDYVLSPDTALSLAIILARQSSQDSTLIESLVRVVGKKADDLIKSSQSDDQRRNSLQPLKNFIFELKTLIQNRGTEDARSILLHDVNRIIRSIKEDLSSTEIEFSSYVDIAIDQVPKIPYRYNPESKIQVPLTGPDGRAHPLVSAQQGAKIGIAQQ